ncbi:unnamed protein product [Rotaria sp. Silwood1]|nr:unnamed protein product [Rotaria sp. Silwood1]
MKHADEDAISDVALIEEVKALLVSPVIVHNANENSINDVTEIEKTGVVLMSQVIIQHDNDVETSATSEENFVEVRTAEYRVIRIDEANRKTNHMASTTEITEDPWQDSALSHSLFYSNNVA